MAAAGCFDPTMEPGDLVLVTKCLRDEGTSHHYLPVDAEAVPDADVNQAFAGAPYRRRTRPPLARFRGCGKTVRPISELMRQDTADEQS